MTSQVDICNLALTKLGDNRIISLDDGTEEADSLSAIYDLILEDELRKRNWRFSMLRTTLPALASTPAFGYDNQYALPSGYLRAIQVGEYFVSENLRNHTGDKTPFYTIENNMILTDMAAPLKFRYVSSAITPDKYDACFKNAFASRLAYELAEDSTQSNSKRQLAKQDYIDAVNDAVVSGAIEVPAEKPQDDSWVLARAL